MPLPFVLQVTIYCIMDITNKRLRQIIREEYNIVLREFACHRADGKWGPCVKGNTLSVLDTNTRVSDKFKGRGTIKGKNKDGTYKLAAKYGSNQSKKTSAGRKTMSGEDISPKYYVGSRYKKQYYNEQELKEQILSTQHTALQQWLASQDSNKEEESQVKLLNDGDGDCRVEIQKAYEKGKMEGQKNILYWIQQYEIAQKPPTEK